jgi:hypothetical protein
MGSAGKDRVLLEKGIILAIRELAQQSILDGTTYDLVAYIILSLEAIGNTIDDSVTAWEKRGYWLKADRYRMEWSWTTKLAGELKQAIKSEDWVNVAKTTAQVSQKMSKAKAPIRHRLGSPWSGAWEQLKRQMK